MKTRIISGAVLVAILIALLVSQLYLPVILVAAVAILCSMSVYEVLYATALCKSKIIVALGMALSLFVPFAAMGYISVPLGVIYTLYIGVLFLAFLKEHNNLDLLAVVSGVLFPVILSYSFSSIAAVAQNSKRGLLYIILLFCWSSVADTGAYFVGVLFGKHKMSPVISPKKSWEGLLGGVVFGVLATFIACYVFESVTGVKVNTEPILIASPVFVLLGVLGDLSASLIKRKCEIKDFGNLIPSHGGILDRFDSILMIAPFFLILLRVI